MVFDAEAWVKVLRGTVFRAVKSLQRSPVSGKGAVGIRGLKEASSGTGHLGFDALGGGTATRALLIDGARSAKLEGVGQFTLRRDQNWRRGEQRLVAAVTGLIGNPMGTVLHPSIFEVNCIISCVVIVRRTFTVSPSLQTYGDRILSREVSWEVRELDYPEFIAFDLEPKVYGRYAAAEEGRIDEVGAANYRLRSAGIESAPVSKSPYEHSSPASKWESALSADTGE